ncbi:MAG: DUF2157 domain-containing protein [Desulfitobacteriaceae bacterium]
MLLTKELNYHESSELITSEQKESILNLYDIKGGLNFIRVVVTIGAILVGLGILSFIASNWDGMSKLLKLGVIFGVFGGANFVAYKLSEDYPKTGLSLIYLGALVYGAGIFLIGQMFNFGGDFYTAFLLWSVGIVPLALQQKDKYLMLFANILFGIYLNASLNQAFPYLAWPGVPALYLAYNYFDRSRLILFFANLTALNFILYLTLYYEVNGLYIALIFFILGLLMYAIKHNLKSEIFRLQGNILFGITGVILTIPDLWSILIRAHATQVTISTVFAIAFVGLLFLLIKKGSLLSLLFICVTIFRYYTDTFAFLPKSLFFIVGGLLLIGFGFYFERMRKIQKGGALV